MRRILALLVLLTPWAVSAEETLMLRYPDVHGENVVFSYAGDLWLAPVDGAEDARRLTSHPGLELFPRFSPDGSHVAFTGQYRGDEQVFVISVRGGEPRQLTFYPTAGPLPARWGTDHQVFGWSPDGQRILFRSGRNDFDNRRLFTVSIEGGLPTMLPMVRAGSGDFSPDGKSLVYSPLFRDFRTWKRYEGGWAQNLFIYDETTQEARQITSHERTERDPVWNEAGVFYVSDQDGTLELFSYDPETETKTQLTHHDEWDVRWASGDGHSRVVYEFAGKIGLYDAQQGTETLLSITVPDDRVRRTARRMEADAHLEDYALAPGGDRAVITGRGDVFSVPVEHGVTRNLSARATAHDREADWSPDGQRIAFVSDRSGEEEIYVVKATGGPARALTKDSQARLYGPTWAPDSRSLVYHDHLGVIRVVDLTGKVTTVYDSPYGANGDYVWSADSKWLTFSDQVESGNRAIFLWSRDSGELHQATRGFFNATTPEFSADGRHLYFASDRQFAPQIGSFEWNYVADRETGLYALALSKDSGTPFPIRSDEALEEEDAQADKKNDKDKDKEEEIRVKVDFEGLADRVIRVPVEPDNFSGLFATESHLLYLQGGPFYYGRSSDVPTKLMAFDFEKRESTEMAAGVSGVDVSPDGKFVLFTQGGALKRLAVGQSDDAKTFDTSNMIVYRAPSDEWMVVFNEVWRRFRDYFYVPNMHGVDWEAERERFRPLVEHVSTREDLNTLIGEMIAELNVGHAYVAGGDLQGTERSHVDLLGAQFVWDESAGHYRFQQIYPGHNEESRYRSPLTEVGIDVNEGDYLLAIDGQPVDKGSNPYALLTDRGDQPVELEVGTNPTSAGSRTVLVDPIRSESSLVYLNWVEKNLDYVSQKTDGKVGYLHIPDMGSAGIYEFIKWYYPQVRKEGLIVDVRGNGGGNVSSMILQRLMKKPLGFGYRAHTDWVGTYPQGAFNGPMVSLISETSASDGDIFPYFFREAGLGPLIGKRTWGGVVGITGHGQLIDGGSVFVPEFGLGQPDKGWIVEGEGVSPDIEVENDPVSGEDAQLDRAIEEVLGRIESEKPVYAPKPAPPVKVD